MKLDIQSPFKELYKAAYVVTNKEPRRVAVLVREDNTKTSMSYAKYLMCVSLNRILEKEEQVDHIDNNKMNDVIENLQILSAKENNIKKIKHLGKETIPITLTCPICNNEFTKPRRQIVTKVKNGKTPTCSRICGGKWSHINKDKELKGSNP